MPLKVPDNYNIISVKNSQNIKVIEYRNFDNGYILFQQQNENGGMNVYTENADDVIFIRIQGEEALIVNKQDQITIIWKYQALFF